VPEFRSEVKLRGITNADVLPVVIHPCRRQAPVIGRVERDPFALNHALDVVRIGEKTDRGADGKRGRRRWHLCHHTASRVTDVAEPAMRLARTWGVIGQSQMSGIAAEEDDGSFWCFRRDQSPVVQSARKNFALHNSGFSGLTRVSDEHPLSLSIPNPVSVPITDIWPARSGISPGERG